MQDQVGQVRGPGPEEALNGKGRNLQGQSKQQQRARGTQSAFTHTTVWLTDQQHSFLRTMVDGMPPAQTLEMLFSEILSGLSIGEIEKRWLTCWQRVAPSWRSAERITKA